jgi:glycerophosphoryl diester phosphodiesterase
MQTQQPIEIVCHRGANEFAPENTYASAQICLDWGMDYVEIDVVTSKDGVLHVFHGPELAKTTNGSGYIFEHTAAELARLDAGSWFEPKFAGERIPRLAPFLLWAKGKIKLFLDVKLADPQQLVNLIYDVGLESDCFFWFELDQLARSFRALAPDLVLKMNANTVAEVEAAVADCQANIIETGYPINAKVLAACRQYGTRLMVNYGGDDEAVFADIIHQGADLVNVDYADRFALVADSLATGTNGS